MGDVLDARGHRVHVRAARCTRRCGTWARCVARWRIETVMNLVGPLANPAGAGRQVIGVASPARLELVAGALRGSARCTRSWCTARRGWTRSRRSARQRCIELRGGRRRRDWTIDPAELRLCRPERRRARGRRSARRTRALIERVLAGAGPAAARGGRPAERRGRDLRERAGADRSRPRWIAPRAALRAGQGRRALASATRGRSARLTRAGGAPRAAQYRRSTPTTMPWIAHLVLLHVDRLQLVVRRLQPDPPVALAVEALHRRRRRRRASR